MRAPRALTPLAFRGYFRSRFLVRAFIVRTVGGPLRRLEASLRSIGYAMLAASLLSSGCGAVIARSRIVSAEGAIAAAGRAGAERKAPYEYTSALLYLEKAREEEAYARFGAAIEFGTLGAQLAEKAKVNAETAEPAEPPAAPQP